jgi:acyl-lipid omega-6 desaturase (Delta-12 desaturase)
MTSFQTFLTDNPLALIMTETATQDTDYSRPTPQEWKRIVLRYQQASTKSALWQVGNTVLPYLGLWTLMYITRDVSWWLTAPLAALTGFLMVRLFILFHDCGHGSFFKSKTANHVFGSILGMFNLTPFAHWRWEHAHHHATSGNLDKRGIGDIWTLTVAEYLAAPTWKKAAYRFMRNPIILFIIGPLFLLGFWQRFASRQAGWSERLSVWGTNVSIVGMAWVLGTLFGWQKYLIIQTIVTTCAGAPGIWLFYVQHQFDGVYWDRHEEWDFTAAALEGSSFYKLPKVLQWFSGNIGFHHIHHLSSRIPNYHLEQCHKSEPIFQTVKPITLRSSLRCLSYRLWDEDSQQLIGYRRLREILKSQTATC